MTRYRKEFIKIAKKLTLSDIQGGISDDFLSLDTLLTDGRVTATSDFFLGVFSQQGIMRILEAFNFIKLLARIGLKEVSVVIDTSTAHTHRLYGYNGPHRPENIICELVVKQGPVNLKTETLSNFPDRTPSLFQIEWLLLQNPAAIFTRDKPQLPGQTYPGLGLGDRLMELFIIMTRRLRLEGIINRPRYFHTAFMFTTEFLFTDPKHQAILHAITRDLLSRYTFHTVAWAAHFGCIYAQKSDNPLAWNPGYLMLPLQKDLIRYFRSREYQKTMQKHERQHHFRLDTLKLKQQMEAHCIPALDTL